MRISIISATVAALGLAACAVDTDPGADRPSVVATTTQVGSIARELGGDDVDLTVLLAPGAEAHDFELTPQAAAAIEDADLVLRSGAGLEGWLDDALDTIGEGITTRDLSEGIELRTTDPAEEEHGTEEDDHEHAGEVDPHYWLSGPSAMVMVENARDALAELLPAAQATIAERAEALLRRIEAADREARELIGAIPEGRRGIVTNHDALGYFIEEYGLRFVASIFPSLDVSAEPSPGDLAELIETIRAEEVVAIFSESAVNPELATAVAAETDAVLVSEPLYVDSLGPEGSGAEMLDAMLIHNARVIHDALAGD